MRELNVLNLLEAKSTLRYLLNAMGWHEWNARSLRKRDEFVKPLISSFLVALKTVQKYLMGENFVFELVYNLNHHLI